MKKLVLFISAVLLVSCGGDNKKKEAGEVEAPAVTVNSYKVVLQGLYEKDDEIVVQYKVNGYIDYEHPVKQTVKGQPTSQQISVAMPTGVDAENFQILISTNKEQKTIDLMNISIFNNDKQLLNANKPEIGKFFDANPGVGYDEKTQKTTLDHSGQFPPGLTGNMQLETLVVQ